MKPGKPIKNKLLRNIALALAFNAAAATAPALAQQPSADTRPDRYAAIVVDANSGRVLYERDATQSLHPASTAKMMTAYLAFQALKDGRLTPEQMIDVSYNAASQPRTNLGMVSATRSTRRGPITYRQNTRSISVEDALTGMLTHSANDAAVVLAEALGGSESNFATLMTREAQRLGMTGTRYTNPNGLPDPRQRTTVEDQALLARAILRDFPEYQHYFAVPRFSFNGYTWNNTNKLLGVYEGLDMGKTGFINASGWNLAASAQRGENRVIGIVFGARTPAERGVDMQRLLDFGFERLGNPLARFRFGRDNGPSGDRYVLLPPAVNTSPDSILQAQPDTVESSPLFPIRMAQSFFPTDFNDAASPLTPPPPQESRDTLQPGDGNDQPKRPEDNTPKAIVPRGEWRPKGPAVS
ncbi:MAG: hypothetical protein K0R10_2689 [Alphaproteobacteria bacterium]|jgi:D-alanyl-D-alanine carboxypeptidase|nr:hypothetical protein [Alphaproteobacteria bacterium]